MEKITEKQIHELMGKEYIRVHSGLYDHLPLGCHVRYFVKGDGSRAARFRQGGFIIGKFLVGDEKKLRLCSSKINRGDQDARSWVVSYNDIDELWKKYNQDCLIELHMITCSLAEKKVQIEKLSARLARVESQLVAKRN